MVGPVSTDLGPALFRVNGRLAARTTSFEEARPELRDALAADRARRAIDSRIEPVENLLAGGATIEDLAAETEMRMGQIDWHEGLRDGIAAYAAFNRGRRGGRARRFSGIEQAFGRRHLRAAAGPVAPGNPPLWTSARAVADGLAPRGARRTHCARARTLADGDRTGAEFRALGLEPATKVTDLTRRGFQAGLPPDFVPRLRHGGRARRCIGRCRARPAGAAGRRDAPRCKQR